MEMCYEGALAMPSSYAVMKEEEMTYVEGGYKVNYNSAFRTKLCCWDFANKLVASKKVKNISVYDVAAEIYTHAFAYYNFSLLLCVASSAGCGAAARAFKSVMNGIDIDNGVDKQQLIGGMKRYQFYRTAYAIGPSVF